MAASAHVHDADRAARAHAAARAFAISLPRFDLMAQLERNPTGLRMGELSRRLMVTGGNVTAITDQLVAEGLVERAADPRRPPRLRRAADRNGQARASTRWRPTHERWIVETVRRLSRGERERLFALLGRIKDSLRAQDAEPRSGGGRMTTTSSCGRLAATRRRISAGRPTRPARSRPITLNRPERKNPLTFASYAELRDLFRALGLRQRRQGGGRHRRRRQLLLGRRRARDHRAADEDGDARSCSRSRG